MIAQFHYCHFLLPIYRCVQVCTGVFWRDFNNGSEGDENII